MLDFKRVAALIKKEGLQIVRDPSSILIAVVLPLLLIFLYGTGVSLDLDHLRIGLVMEDTAPDAARFAQSFTDCPYFDVKLVRDRRELELDLERGSIRGFVVIPSYFSEFRTSPSKTAPIQVIADGSEANTANFLQYYVQGAFQNWLSQESLISGIKELSLVNVEPRFWYNEALESRFFLLSGSLGVIMTLIGTLLTALVVSREWVRGTMEALIATPVGKWEIVIGKVVPYFFLGVFSMTICLLAATLVYDLPFRGSLLALYLTTSCFLFSALGTGLLISILSKIQTIASQISITAGFLPAYILSGFLFEISSMPKWIQALTHLIPARYFVQNLQTLFLVGNVWGLFWKNIFVMLLISLFLFFLISRKLTKRLD
jgi:ABC-2 type transport system permease protein